MIQDKNISEEGVLCTVNEMEKDIAKWKLEHPYKTMQQQLKNCHQRKNAITTHTPKPVCEMRVEEWYLMLKNWDKEITNELRINAEDTKLRASIIISEDYKELMKINRQQCKGNQQKHKHKHKGRKAESLPTIDAYT
jgi:hypothetical protein